MNSRKRLPKYDSWMLVIGDRKVIQQMINNSLHRAKEVHFPAILPLPDRLPFSGPTVKPYLDFITWACLEAYFYDNIMSPRLNVSEIVRTESNYLAINPDISAAKWVQSKEEFLKRHRGVAPNNFKAFYTMTRPFSSWAALWCLEDYIKRFDGHPTALPAAFEHKEADYFKTYDKSCNSGRWERAKEAFRQCLDQASPAFDRFRMELWGAVRDTEAILQTFSHDGSILFTFSTLGGPADNIVQELSKQYPELTFTHTWVNTVDSRDKGCMLYSQR